LSFTNDGFDVVVAALIINFIPDREKAISEMQRVPQFGGTVAAYVWDFAFQRGVSHPLTSELRLLKTGRRA
jgi:ubiquinone/menaquinone biosynthesis C-methylase UbiE